MPVLRLVTKTTPAQHPAPAEPRRLRVAVLVDLPRTALSGGHVKCWERLTDAASRSHLPLDLTVYFSGSGENETLSPHTRMRFLPPVLSTARLKFLPYVPDHTDLSPWHAKLARELANYDLIHTTDGFFAFAKTAERISRAFNIPLTTSIHTDTPSYTRIFTRQTIEKLFTNWPRIRKFLIDVLEIPERQGRVMEQKLKQHISLCDYAMMTRDEDHAMGDALLGKDRVQHLRLGVDKDMFNPNRRDRAGIESDYDVPKDRIIVLFVGRVDVGKNIYTLINAMERLIAEGLPLHLIAAGVGPALADVKTKLAGHVSAPGFIAPNELARLYASVDMLALSSEVEIRSMVGVEAMMSGCPVLVSRKSGVAALFACTPAMLEVDSGEDAWTDALRRFALTPNMQSAMRQAASDYSANHLASWLDVFTQDVFAIWSKAAADHNAKAD